MTFDIWQIFCLHVEMVERQTEMVSHSPSLPQFCFVPKIATCLILCFPFFLSWPDTTLLPRRKQNAVSRHYLAINRQHHSATCKITLSKRYLTCLFCLSCDIPMPYPNAFSLLVLSHSCSVKEAMARLIWHEVCTPWFFFSHSFFSCFFFLFFFSLFWLCVHVHVLGTDLVHHRHVVIKKIKLCDDRNDKVVKEIKLLRTVGTDVWLTSPHLSFSLASFLVPLFLFF